MWKRTPHTPHTSLFIGTLPEARRLVCVYVCMYLYACMYVFVCVCMYICMYICGSILLYVHTRTYMQTNNCVSTCKYYGAHAHTYIHTHAYIQAYRSHSFRHMLVTVVLSFPEHALSAAAPNVQTSGFGDTSRDRQTRRDTHDLGVKSLCKCVYMCVCVNMYVCMYIIPL
jgi:hypothetical protein